MPIRPIAVSGGTVIALVLGFGAVSVLPGTAPVASAQELVAYDSCGELLEHYRAELERTAQPWGFGGGGSTWLGGSFARSPATR